MAEHATPNAYRWAAFTHWSNLALLTTLGISGALVDPSAWILLAPVQLLVLWLAPDLPPLRRAVDARTEQAQRDAERAYYLDQLWSLRPLPQRSVSDRLVGLFVGAPEPEPDTRLSPTPDNARYLEMRDIVSKLREMVPIAQGRVKLLDIERLDRVVVGYLRILFATQPLSRAVQDSDEVELGTQLVDVNARLQGADATLRPVLLERKRLIETQLARVPRLRATLELLRTRAEAIPQQLRNVHSQVLTDPGSEVHALLDDMIERNDMLSDPLADLAADDAVRELLSQSAPAAPKGQTSAVRAAAARKLGSTR
jgi:hypothetical protein